MNAAYAAAAGAAATSSSTTMRRSTCKLGALDARQQRVHLRRAGPLREPDRRVDEELPPSAQPLRFATNRASCARRPRPGLDYLRCLGSDAFVKDVFLDSDTDLMVLSFVPSTRKGEPLTIEEAAATARIVEKMQGTHRMLHPRARQPQPGRRPRGHGRARGALQDRRVEDVYAVGPRRKGFFLDDEPGLAMIEKARKLGIRNIAMHKGLPFGPQSYEHSTCVDVGRVAKRFPDVNFLIYHSGFVAGKPERAYDPQPHRRHRRARARACSHNGIKPGRTSTPSSDRRGAS